MQAGLNTSHATRSPVQSAAPTAGHLSSPHCMTHSTLLLPWLSGLSCYENTQAKLFSVLSERRSFNLARSPLFFYSCHLLRLHSNLIQNDFSHFQYCK